MWFVAALLLIVGAFLLLISLPGLITTISADPWPRKFSYTRRMSAIYTLIMMVAGCSCIVLATRILHYV